MCSASLCVSFQGMQGTGCVKVLDAETFQLEFDIRCEGRAVSGFIHSKFLTV